MKKNRKNPIFYFLFSTFSRSGFTLIEILVVIAVTALFSGLVISYSKVGENQISLEIERQKIANFILSAKSLSIATLDVPSDSGRMLCGLGFEITYSDDDAGNASYRIFSYQPPAGTDCGGIAQINRSLRVDVPSGVLPAPFSSGETAANVYLRKAPPCTLHSVLFIPPGPRTLISNVPAGLLVPASDGCQSFNVYLETPDGSFRKSIQISRAGQVDF